MRAAAETHGTVHIVALADFTLEDSTSATKRSVFEQWSGSAVVRLQEMLPKGKKL